MLTMAKLVLALSALGDAALWTVAVLSLLRIANGVDSIINRLKKTI